jgi:phage terminase large subunit-like protein
MPRKTTSSSKQLNRVTAYAKAVLAKKIIAGPHVRNACQRHLDDLEKGEARGLRFDEEEADRILRFFENVLHLSEGQFEGKPFQAEPSQAFILGSLAGWKRLSKDHGWVRRFRRAYIEQGKGNGKSPLVGGLGLYGLSADNEAGAEIYSAGATKDQASILFRDAVKMVRQSPDLEYNLKTSGGEGKEYNLAFLKNMSFFRPISREAKKTGSGPRPHMALCDEVHEHPDRGVMEMLERGFKFRRQPLLVMITNSGTDRNSVCWEEHEHAIKVAAGNLNARNDDAFYIGEPVDDTTFSYVCALDKGDDPLKNPKCWIKANPLLGVTITEEYLAGVVAQAKSMPGKLNSILRLHFCTWTDAETAWMTQATLEPCIVDFEPLYEHAQKPVFLGADLSQVKDITALAYCVQSGKVDGGEHDGKPVYDAWVQAWTPGDTLAARAMMDKLPYELWVEQGYLNAPKGQSINYRHVAQALAEAQHDYNIQCLAYDRYAFSRMLEPEMQELGLNIECVEHPQGGTKKGKATEAMKQAAKDAGRDPEGLWMPMSVRQVEELILEGRLRIQRNPVTISAMMSAVTDKDRWGNYWLAKEHAVNKIDAAVALCMAVGAARSFEGNNGIDDWLASFAE